MKVKEIYFSLKNKYKDYVIIIKIGSFYNVISKDAYILSSIFNYKINTFSNTVKVGFPLTSLNKVLNTLDKIKINYLVYENNIVIRQKFKRNNYQEFSQNNLTVKERIDAINLKLNEIAQTPEILKILEKVENEIWKKN